MGLRNALSAALGGAEIENLVQLSSGASRETWSFSSRGRSLILQRDAAGADALRLGLGAQAQLMRAARDAGVPVPSVVAEGGALGDAMIVEGVEGETIARKILRDEEFAKARSVLAAQCGETLAHIHSIPLERAPSLPNEDQLALFRGLLDASGQPHPAFELGFRWLERTRPSTSGRRVVHGDFRLGNLIVGGDGLRAVLDWELAHIGDPLEDLGWLCVKAWRFGGVPAVGGFGDREDLYDAYERASGAQVDRDAALWWEVFGTLRWGIICILQSSRHLSGAERSLELASIGRRIAETEHDLMELLP